MGQTSSEPELLSPNAYLPCFFRNGVAAFMRVDMKISHHEHYRTIEEWTSDTSKIKLHLQQKYYSQSYADAFRKHYGPQHGIVGPTMFCVSHGDDPDNRILCPGPMILSLREPRDDQVWMQVWQVISRLSTVQVTIQDPNPKAGKNDDEFQPACLEDKGIATPTPPLALLIQRRHSQLVDLERVKGSDVTNDAIVEALKHIWESLQGEKWTRVVIEKPVIYWSREQVLSNSGSHHCHNSSNESIK